MLLLFKTKKELGDEVAFLRKSNEKLLLKHDKLVDEYGSVVNQNLTYSCNASSLNRKIKNLEEKNDKLRKRLVDSEEKLLLLFKTTSRKVRIKNLIESCSEPLAGKHGIPKHEKLKVYSIDYNSMTVKEVEQDNEGENNEEPTGFILSEN